jgi:hypothetical protein
VLAGEVDHPPLLACKYTMAKIKRDDNDMKTINIAGCKLNWYNKRLLVGYDNKGRPKVNPVLKGDKRTRLCVGLMMWKRHRQ